MFGGHINGCCFSLFVSRCCFPDWLLLYSYRLHLLSIPLHISCAIPGVPSESAFAVFETVVGCLGVAPLDLVPIFSDVYLSTIAVGAYVCSPPPLCLRVLVSSVFTMADAFPIWAVGVVILGNLGAR